eukprot:jgi/Chlat1/4819/Chrsp31S04861
MAGEAPEQRRRRQESSLSTPSSSSSSLSRMLLSSSTSPFRCVATRAPFPRFVLLLLLLHLLASPTPPLAEAKRRRSSKRSDDDDETTPAPAGPTHLTAWERGLAGTQLSYKTLLQEARLYHSDTSTRRLAAGAGDERFAPTITLGYVTPWNALGYELAERFAPKFTHIAPVWYQVRKSASSVGLELAGAHDTDLAWARRVQQGGKQDDSNNITTRTRIVPRFILEGFEGKEAAGKFLASDALKQRCVDLIVRECVGKGWDGAVFEGFAGWSYSGSLQDPHTRKLALDFIQHLAGTLAATTTTNNNNNDDNIGPNELILAVPPPGAPHFTRVDFMRLAPHVAAFSLMTYDYSHPGRPGPCAPLPWVRHCLEELLDTPAGRPHTKKKRHASSGWDVNVGIAHTSGQVHEFASKLLLGLNFYGNDFQLIPQGGGPIVGGQFLDNLSQARPKLVWDLESQEHYFDYASSDGSTHRMYYPTAHSIEVRLDEVRARGIGIAIWELGQGLEHFMDLL